MPDALDAGAVHEHVDAAEAQGGGAHGRGHALLVAYVHAVEEQRVGRRRLDGGPRRRIHRLLEVHAHHARAFLCEAERAVRADSRSRARHERHLAIQSTHGLLL